MRHCASVCPLCYRAQRSTLILSTYLQYLQMNHWKHVFERPFGAIFPGPVSNHHVSWYRRDYDEPGLLGIRCHPQGSPSQALSQVAIRYDDDTFLWVNKCMKGTGIIKNDRQLRCGIKKSQDSWREELFKAKDSRKPPVECSPGAGYRIF